MFLSVPIYLFVQTNIISVSQYENMFKEQRQNDYNVLMFFLFINLDFSDAPFDPRAARGCMFGVFGGTDSFTKETSLGRGQGLGSGQIDTVFTLVFI